MNTESFEAPSILIDTLKDEFIDVIKKVLPEFYYKVTRHAHWDKTQYLKIMIACNNYEINRVTGQYPQCVSLMWDISRDELTVQIFGCMGGNRIFTKPMKNPRLAMDAIKISFRKAKSKESALKALEKFCKTYKDTLKTHKDILMYQQFVNYNELLGE